MNVAELIDAYRDETSDTAKPYFVSNATALRYLNEAQTEAARRAHLLIDSSSAVARASVSMGDPVVSIDSRVIAIRRLRLSSATNQLRKYRAREMDETNPGWDASTSQSTPICAVLDYDTDAICLYPIPAKDDELAMTVVREPMEAMSVNQDIPEISPRWHAGLIEWMKFRAYTNDDSELYDEKKAARALGIFEQEFGPKRSASDEVFEAMEYHNIGEL